MQARILSGEQIRVTTEPREIEAAVDGGQLIWIELDKHDHECDQLLARTLHLHALTIEDIWSERPQPKIEQYDGYIYIIIHGVRSVTAEHVRTAELDMVIGKTFVITHDPHHLCADVETQLHNNPNLLAKGPAWLAHALLDHAVDQYMPVIDDLDAEIEDMENEVLRKAGTKLGPPVLRKILRFKRMLLELRRMAVHQREILLRLSRGELELIPKDVLPFYRDVFDHFLRVNDLVESYRDLVTSALEAYLSVQSNRMNDIMKTLTLISTVMLPITFIAGLYGMNFKFMPELQQAWGYPAALGLMLLVVIACFIWFRRKGWIGSAELDVPGDDEDAAAAEANEKRTDQTERAKK